MKTKVLEKQKINLIERPPIVVVLGHIDHGKTTLLDHIRKSAVAQREAGGITQHIGAYEIEHKGKRLTFIDTPGHEAFDKIRSRGVKVADAAILVVAADEGVKPQTLEALKHIEEGKIPFVVALTKIDKPEANTQRIKQQLAEANILLEEWGGKIPSQELSAKTGQGISELLDLLALVIELEELKADPAIPGRGVVIESHRDAQKGVLASLIINSGTLKVGSWIVAESAMGKIKAMDDADGKRIDKASFSSPVRVLGFDEIPPVGSEFISFETKEEAQAKLKAAAVKRPVIVDETGGDAKILRLILRADTHGSLEALEKVLLNLKFEEVSLRILDSYIGDISDADVRNAETSRAQIIGFNVKTIPAARNLILTTKVQVFSSKIIYEIIDRVKEELTKLLSTETRRIDLGKLKILAIFKKSAAGQVIGGKVTTGKAKRGAFAEIIREGKTIAKGRLAQLQHQKSETPEVREGNECGILFVPSEGEDAKEGDSLEIYEEETIKKELKTAQDNGNGTENPKA